MKKSMLLLSIVGLFMLLASVSTDVKAEITCDNGGPCKCMGSCEAFGGTYCIEKKVGCILKCECLVTGTIWQGVRVYCDECSDPGKPAKWRPIVVFFSPY